MSHASSLLSSDSQSSINGLLHHPTTKVVVGCSVALSALTLFVLLSKMHKISLKGKIGSSLLLGVSSLYTFMKWKERKLVVNGEWISARASEKAFAQGFVSFDKEGKAKISDFPQGYEASGAKPLYRHQKYVSTWFGYCEQDSTPVYEEK